MFYYLLYERLFRYATPMRVFRYVTVRTAVASLTALFLCIALGPWLINKLRQFQIGQYIREEGPKSHQKKAGTPTMGGVLIIISIVVPTLMWADLRYPYVWVAIAALLGYGWIGFMDDYAKVTRRRNLGLTGRAKLIYQFLMGFIFAALLLWMRSDGQFSTAMNIPFIKQFKPSLIIASLARNPWTYVLGVLPFCAFTALVVVFMSNAVNLTDGLDGLAIGLMVIAAGALTVLTYAGGHATLAEYLQLARNQHSSELTVFCGSMTGASIGFLWYNAHPAEIFMGDVGSLGLGGDRRSDQAGSAAAVHRRHFHPRSRFSGSAGGQLQAARRKANLQDGAAPSPFRGDGMGRIEDYRPVLDRRPGAGAVRIDDVEVEVGGRDSSRSGL